MQRLTNGGGRRLAVQLDHFVHNGDAKAERPAKAGEALGMAHPAPAKAEIETDRDMADRQTVDQNVAHELLVRHRGHCAIEG